MFGQSIRLGLTWMTMALLVAGCTSTQTAPPAVTAASSPTVSPLVPTATQTTPPPTSAPSPMMTPTTSASLTSDVVRFVLVSEKSQARYRVREQLANLSLPNDAIGSTRQFTGTMVIKPDGTLVSSESRFVVNLGTLQSDQSRRDNYLRQNVLQTDQYPTAVFVPTQVTGLPSPLPQSGPVSFKLTGDLTIRNVTKPVTWDVTNQVQGDLVTGQATTSFKFDYFGLTQPRVPVVLSVEDNIKLELDITLQRAGN